MKVMKPMIRKTRDDSDDEDDGKDEDDPHDYNDCHDDDSASQTNERHETKVSQNHNVCYTVYTIQLFVLDIFTTHALIYFLHVYILSRQFTTGSAELTPDAGLIEESPENGL